MTIGHRRWVLVFTAALVAGGGADGLASQLPAPGRLHARPAGVNVIHAVCDPVPGAAQYRFTNLDTGAESAWQDSTRWVDMSVVPGVDYAYQVQARRGEDVTSPVTMPAVGRSFEHPLEGWGVEHSTVGGLYQSLFEVTTIADAGVGSLREALSAGNRYIVFRVSGTIRLESRIRVVFANITLDGSSAPAPGITIQGPPTRDAIDFDEALPAVAHDILVRHLRFQNSGKDNVAVGGRGDRDRSAGCHDLVFDHCSFLDGADGNLDIVHAAHNVTVQYCIAGRDRKNIKNVLISSSAVDSVWNVSFHHNFLHSSQRNPQIQGRATGIDVVNNVVSGWGTHGIRLQCRSPDGAPCDPPSRLTANVVGNVFVPADSSKRERAIQAVGVDPGRLFVEGNWTPRAHRSPGRANERWRPGPAIGESPADAEMARALLESVGPRHRSEVEARWIRDTTARLSRMRR